MRQGVLRLLRLNASPHGIALGFALGLGLSLIPLPFVGMFVALALAPLLRASMPATYAGTAVVNPLTGAFFYFAELWIGARLLGVAAPSWAEVRAFDSHAWVDLFLDLLPAFALGGLVCALSAALLTYPSVRAAAAWVQARHEAEHEDEREDEQANSSQSGNLS
nr:DUF2062 domain-containing protein [Pseudenhygromyxa sp. WMMC2535]